MGDWDSAARGEALDAMRGVVLRVDGLRVWAHGLLGAMLGERVTFADSAAGLVEVLGRAEVQIVLLDAGRPPRAGEVEGVGAAQGDEAAAPRNGQPTGAPMCESYALAPNPHMTNEPDCTERDGGVVRAVEGSTVVVEGLPGAAMGEVVAFARGALGVVASLERSVVRVDLLDESRAPRPGEAMRATGRLLEIVVGDGSLGRVVDALGRPLDEGSPIEGARRPLRIGPRSVTALDPAGPLLSTGVRQIDLLAPLLRGQAAGVVAEALGGKTCLAVDIVAAHDAPEARCVYVCPGLDRSAAVHAMLRASGALARTVVVSAPGGSRTLTRLAPRGGAALADAFRGAGQQVLLVWDEVDEGDDASLVTEHAGAWGGTGAVSVLTLARTTRLLAGRVDHLLVFDGRTFLLDFDSVWKSDRYRRRMQDWKWLMTTLIRAHELQEYLGGVSEGLLDEDSRAVLASRRTLVREVLAQPPHSPEPIERTLTRAHCAIRGLPCDGTKLDELTRAHAPLMAALRARGRLSEPHRRALDEALRSSR